MCNELVKSDSKLHSKRRSLILSQVQPNVTQYHCIRMQHSALLRSGVTPSMTVKSEGGIGTSFPSSRFKGSWLLWIVQKSKVIVVIRSTCMDYHSDVTPCTKKEHTACILLRICSLALFFYFLFCY